MKALITGINGFVGKYLTKLLLSQGIEVWGSIISESERNNFVLIPKKKLIVCDIRNREQVKNLLQTASPDYMFHLAAQSNVAKSWENIIETYDINMMGTINLLDEMVNTNISKILLIGSSEEYGKLSSEYMPLNEQTPLNPETPYGSSKASISLLFKQYYYKYKLPVVMARSFNHIGAGQALGFVTSDFAKQIAEIEKGKKEPLISVGNLEARRDFTSVSDVVRAYLLLAEKGVPGEVYNVASGRAFAIQEILDILLAKAKIKIEVTRDTSKMRPSDVPLMYGDNTKLKNQTGWKPEMSIEECLAEVLEYWRKMV